MTDAPALLLVEDSDTQALQLQLLLEGEGFRVHREASAEGALEHLNASRPDLMVVDYRLPGMNGDELARRLRMNANTRTLPLLLLTDERTGGAERQGLDSGASAYLSKSADRQVLLARLRVLLRRRQIDEDQDRSDVPFRRARLLLIEESATFRLMLVQALGAEGYEVDARGGDDGLAELAAHGRFDAVLVALDAHGYDAVALVRAIDAARAGGGAEFELIGLGGVDGRGEGARLAEGFTAGADDIFPKTGDRETLMVRVRAVVRRKLMRDEEARLTLVRRDRERALARAQAEAASADALAQVNRDLASSNARLRETQAQLVQAAKMASLGELVAGIAHELNNPLAFIVAHCATVDRLVRDAAAAGDPDGRLARAHDRLGAMEGGLERIRDLITKLRTFSRFEEGEVMAIDVPAALDAIVGLLAPKLARVTVERDDRAPPTLTASPALMNQVVANLVSNAADAMGEAGGTIRIATRLEGGRYLIEVGDSGPGVPTDKRDRVFEPFFTTKDVGAGTGLGLAIAYGVVQAHGGEIEVGESPLGGALFTVAIPCEEAA